MPAPSSTDVLLAPDAGTRVIRGGAVRALGYGMSVGLAAITSAFLFRYLGVGRFGQYAVVAALLGIVAALTEAGLSAVGSRDLAVLRTQAERDALLENLLALRLILTTLGIAVAALFAVAIGYEHVIVAGTLLAGIGVVLLNTQVTMSLPLRVALRMVPVTTVEVLNQAVTCLLVGLLVAAGAPLLAFFGVQIVVGAVAVGVTAAFVGAAALRLRLDRAVVVPLIRETLPLAAAVAMNVVYLRMLVIFVSLLSTETQTGLFATSFRVFEMLVGLPTLVLSIALPLLAVAGVGDRPRFRYGMQRLVEIALVVSLFEVVVVVAVAEPALVLLGGSQFEGAAKILQIQAFALVGVFLGQALTLGLVALRRQRAVAAANAVALCVVVVLGAVLVPAYGAEGGAVAAVVTELGLALLLLILLRRGSHDVAPAMGFVWRPLLAGAAGLGATLALHASLNGWVVGAVATVVFAVVALVTQAVPAEVRHALRAGALR